MLKRIWAIVFIFACVSVAWFGLAGSMAFRTERQDSVMESQIGELWGKTLQQYSPVVRMVDTRDRETLKEVDGKAVKEVTSEAISEPRSLRSSDISVALKLEPRKKGLLWYSTYEVDFAGTYEVSNNSDEVEHLEFEYRFPDSEGVYDNFTFAVDGDTLKDAMPVDGVVVTDLHIQPGGSRQIRIAYDSRGMSEWWYYFGSGVTRVQNYRLTMTTDFTGIDFPANSMSPSTKERVDSGWRLTWKYDDLISGLQIGMVMPRKLNPGPFVSKVTFFAPVSLFFFFFIIFMITTIKNIKVHPMNYLFVAAAFFSFHLLMAYMVDHVNIHVSFAVSALVSILLTVSYMRLVVGARFAFVETGIAQLIYLILFSYAFFLEGYTGLTITVFSILTLFVVMQLTGRIDWEEKFRSGSTTVKTG